MGRKFRRRAWEIGVREKAMGFSKFGSFKNNSEQHTLALQKTVLQLSVGFLAGMKAASQCEFAACLAASAVQR